MSSEENHEVPFEAPRAPLINPGCFNPNLHLGSLTRLKHSRTCNRSSSLAAKGGRNLMPCVVCGTDTYWSFYGAMVCDPCRTFFRRQVLSNRVSDLSKKLNDLMNKSLCISFWYANRPSSVKETKIVRSIRKHVKTVVGVALRNVSSVVWRPPWLREMTAPKQSLTMAKQDCKSWMVSPRVKEAAQ